MLFMFFTYIALYIFFNLLHLFLLLGGWILRILGKAIKFQPTDFFFFLCVCVNKSMIQFYATRYIWIFFFANQIAPQETIHF